MFDVRWGVPGDAYVHLIGKTQDFDECDQIRGFFQEKSNRKTFEID